MLRTFTIRSALLLLACLATIRGFPFKSSRNQELVNNRLQLDAPGMSLVRQIRKDTSMGPFRPYISFKNPLPPTVVLDESTKFLSCEVMGAPNPRVYWMKNNKKIDQGGYETFDDKLKHGDLSLSLVASRLFLDALPEPEGMYTCVGEANPEKPGQVKKQIFGHTKVIVPGNVNKEAERYENALEFVKPMNAASYAQELSLTGSKARIFFWTETLLEHIGADALLHCRASGFPAPSVTWIVDENKLIVPDSHKYTILPSGDLLIRNITFDDMNRYMCSATNRHGSDINKKMFLYPSLPDDEEEKK